MTPHRIVPPICLASLLLAGCQPPMPDVQSAKPATPQSAASTAPAASTISVLTDPGNGTQCAGRNVHITRDDFRVVLEGDCGDIVVTASQGSLNVDRARSIRVEGSQVTVLNEDVDSLTVTGNGNTFNMTRVGSAEIRGDGNGLLGKEYGKVVFGGSDNYVNADNQPAVEDQGTQNRVI